MATENSKKKALLTELFKRCQTAGDYTFNNTLVKKVADEIGFKNPFDATKIDNSDILPPLILKHDYFISHLGQGNHCFVPGIANGYHVFEDITDQRDWNYTKSLLNEFDTSESNILSVSFNQGIIHDFLYEDDRRANPNIYGARRTKASFNYKIGKTAIAATKVQMEIDMTTEYNGHVTVFEGKNEFPHDFAVYQLYHPFLYYHELRKAHGLKIAQLNCCYLVRRMHHDGSIIRVYLYDFTDPYNMASIRLIKSRQYHLTQK